MKLLTKFLTFLESVGANARQLSELPEGLNKDDVGRGANIVIPVLLFLGFFSTICCLVFWLMTFVGPEEISFLLQGTV